MARPGDAANLDDVEVMVESQACASERVVSNGFGTTTAIGLGSNLTQKWSCS
jgi:hypothetical protein